MISADEGLEVKLFSNYKYSKFKQWPDFLIDNQLYMELKNTTTKKAKGLKKNLEDGLYQIDNEILKLPGHVIISNSAAKHEVIDLFIDNVFDKYRELGYYYLFRNGKLSK